MESPKDPLYDKAVTLIRARNKASLSLIQRTFMIGYNRAARLLEAMEINGVVSASDEAGYRKVLDTPPA